MRMRQAVVAALRDAMRDDQKVVVIGEDVAAAGGVFKTTEGLVQEFGVERVRDTPISEMGFLGAGVGAAMAGLRPVVEVMFVEFMGVAMDQLLTEAAKMRFLAAGRLSVPLVVRASIGAGLGFGAQHSQTLETWIMGTPGVKLAVASGSASAYGLLRAAIRDPDPVVILEPRRLYAQWEEFEPSDYDSMTLGSSRKLRDGSDVTIVALGGTVPSVMEGTDTKDWSADVIDLSSVVPWDKEAVLESVRRTRRLVTVEENPLTGGWGTEVVAHVCREAFGDLENPPFRITAPDTPIPFAQNLEAQWVPGVTYIKNQLDEFMATGRVPQPWWNREQTA